MKQLILMICSSFFFAGFLSGQDESDLSTFFESMVEEKWEEQAASGVPDDIYEDYEFYRDESLNLNTASAKELHQLNILNDFQIAALLDYRKRTPLVTLYELLYVPGFRTEDVQRLLPLAVCEETKTEPSINQASIRELKHQVLLRHQRILEQSEGYRLRADTASDQQEEQTGFSGGPDKLLLRYTLDIRKQVKANLIAEKDPGEKLFDEGKIAFISACIGYRSEQGFLRRLLIGDYRVQAGQGLLMWNAYSPGKSSGMSGIAKTGPLIRESRSAAENMHLRGMVLGVGIKDLSLTAFLSVRRLDATPADTMKFENAFTSLLSSGLHNTPSSLYTMDLVREDLLGGSLRFDRNRIRLGLNFIFQRYDKWKMPDSELYRAFQFQGNVNSGASFDYRWLAGKMQFFGEFSRSNNACAMLNGALFYIRPGLTIRLLHRSYQAGYYASLASAFGENSTVNNEKGFFFGVELEPGKGHWYLSLDVFSFAWLRYGVNVPSQGYDLTGKWERKFGAIDLQAYYRHRLKMKNSDPSGALSRIGQMSDETGKIRMIADLRENMSLEVRGIVRWYRTDTDNCQASVFISNDLVYRSADKRMGMRLRIARFWAEDYSCRIYVYEHDLPLAGSVQMHYGRGWRVSVLLSLRTSRALKISLKLAQSYYPDADGLGEGLNRIEGKHKTEIRTQLILSF